MKNRTIRLTFLTCAILVMCIGISALGYGEAVVSISPAEIPSPAVGQQLTVDIAVSDANGVAGYELTLGFDTSALTYVSAENGSYLSGAFFPTPTVSGSRVPLTAAAGSAAAASSGTLAKVTFRVTSVKASTLQLSSVFLSDISGDPVSVRSVNGRVVKSETAPWDVNKDGKVNVSDLVLVARKDPRGDVNSDGKINVSDLVLVAKHLGETTTPGDETTDNGGNMPPQPDPYQNMELIPAGEFRMGSNSAGSNEKPVHSVYVDAFYMDKYEVTNAEYAEFLNAKGKHTERGQIWLDIGDGDERIEYISRKYQVKAGYENHPVVEVSWYGAMAYAEWKGKRLPTEAEWEKAARGGLSGLTYPWGNTIDSSRANYNNHVRDTTAVGKYAANGYGLYDMSGNVWEWCLDEYNANFYAISPSQNPLSGANSIQWLLDNYTGVKTSRVLRGGSWHLSAANYVRCARRGSNTPTGTHSDLGFRCARTVSP